MIVPNKILDKINRNDETMIASFAPILQRVYIIAILAIPSLIPGIPNGNTMREST